MKHIQTQKYYKLLSKCETAHVELGASTHALMHSSFFQPIACSTLPVGYIVCVYMHVSFFIKVVGACKCVCMCMYVFLCVFGEYVIL